MLDRIYDFYENLYNNNFSLSKMKKSRKKTEEYLEALEEMERWERSIKWSTEQLKDAETEMEEYHKILERLDSNSSEAKEILYKIEKCAEKIYGETCCIDVYNEQIELIKKEYDIH